MNFKFGKIPENSNFNPQSEGWTAIKEPSLWIAQLISLPIGLITAAVLGIFWYTLTPLRFTATGTGLFFLAWIAGIIVLHELIHAVFHPGFGTTSNTYLGFWPSRLLFYAHYNSVLSRQRFMAILITPFVFISIAPLLFCALFQYSSTTLFATSVFNSLLACVDILGFNLIYFGVPSGSRVQNKEWKTYYKISEQKDASNPSSPDTRA